MPKHQTLEELKQANEQADETDVEEDVQSPEDETTEEEAEAPTDEASTEEEADVDKETDETEDSGEENNDWMKADDEESDKKFTDADIGRAKAKFKAKLDKQHNAELETLRAELEAEKNKATAPPNELKMPNRDDYLDEDDPDTAFMIALSQYNQKVSDANRDAHYKAEQTRQANEASLATISRGVDEHYERVAELAEKSGITPEQYQSAELNVRSLVDSLYPDAGDGLVDAFISKVGKGSEKVFYNLGINKVNRAKFREALQNDPTGLDAVLFLGEMKANLNNPPKRRSNTPPPAEAMKGDKSENSATKSLRTEYEKASKSRDMQAQFNIRRKAKAAGIPTREINQW